METIDFFLLIYICFKTQFSYLFRLYVSLACGRCLMTENVNIINYNHNQSILIMIRNIVLNINLTTRLLTIRVQTAMIQRVYE